MKTSEITARGEKQIADVIDGLGHVPAETMAQFTDTLAQQRDAADLLLRSVSRHATSISSTHRGRARRTMQALQDALSTAAGAGARERPGEALQAYLRDVAERMALTMDVLRERGDVFLDHEAAGCPPVLDYEYEVIVDGHTLESPCNYDLLRIVPPAGVTVHDAKRPYVIIDPRAGHGGGIGGFKPDSQVGVALKAGNPVYFVSFRRDPVPGQTLADVTNAEAAFLRTVMKRHAKSSRPVVVGNCQGGWASLILAATHPDLSGPVVVNGAPVSTWSGEVGVNPMRYNGGVLGGTWLPMFMSDLGGGVFDGAHLVMNFELLNPSRNFFRKYYDLYSKVDTERERFLSFERWWGGYFLLNEAEIRWIVEQLFVGNRLTRNMAQIEPGRPIDLKKINAPIIVFASHGDNITPPQQALNWISDTYSDVEEIRIRGQRIVYMVHETVGHLGIFVSAKVAQKEHAEVTSTLKTIEALPPGLYEMVVEAVEGRGQDAQFTVSFAERTIDDIRKIDDGREDEEGFGAVARVSEMQSEIYDMTLRPMVQAMVSAPMSEMVRAAHPLRTQRSMMSSMNPFMAMFQHAAETVRADRHPVDADNPFVKAEHVAADLVEQWLDMGRDVRDAMYETIFFSLWGTPAARAFGRSHALRRTLKSEGELRGLPEVQSALMRVSRGGFVEAVIRMLVMLADNRGSVRRDRLERSAKVLTFDAPFSQFNADERAHIIREQTLIATFLPEQAIATLPDLLPKAADKALAVAVAQYVPGKIEEMSPNTVSLLQRFREVLGQPVMTEDIEEDPLATGAGKEVTTAAE
ncbi:MAG: DUF3141 domain-containing protein [Pseudomonadota bacterium]